MLPGVVLLIASIYLTVRFSVVNTVTSIETNNSHSMLDIAMLSIENEYNSLDYHKEHLYKLRKQERENIVAVALSIINKYHNEYKLGKKSLNIARKSALDDLNSIKYDDGNGYVWVNNTEQPIPRLLRHPIRPELNNKLATDSIFYATADSVNLLSLAVSQCQTKGSGYINYLWLKPKNKLADYSNLKISYVEIFEPWQWIVGTGVYIDDIDAEIEIRKKAIIQELKTTLGNVAIGKDGYFYIFNGNKEIIIHPSINQKDIDSVVIKLNNTLPFNEIINASRTNQVYKYKWYNPAINNKNKEFDKIVFVRYFKELDWYVCASIYKNEIEYHSLTLANKILGIMLVFTFFALLLVVLISNNIANPIIQLQKFVTGIDLKKEQYQFSETPIQGSIELKKLGEAIKEMLISIDKQNSQLIKSKLKAEESDKLKTSFLANMSHEIRTPLNAIIGFSSLIIDELDENKRKTYFNAIYNSSEDLILLVDDVLDLAKIESNYLKIIKRKCNLNALFHDIEQVFNSLINKYGKQDSISKQLLIPKTDFFIVTDCVRVKQIVSNLISNAIKFSDTGLIEYGYKIKENEIYLYVKDEGIGILLEQYQSIFERFVTHNDNKAKTYRGTGLGLSISKNMVELLGGQIGVSSEFGKGSIFYFTLPINNTL